MRSYYNVGYTELFLFEYMYSHVWNFLYRSIHTIFIWRTRRNKHVQYMIIYCNSLQRKIGLICHLLVKYLRNSWLYKNKSATSINTLAIGTVKNICNANGDTATPFQLIIIMIYIGIHPQKSITNMKIICFNKRATRWLRVSACTLFLFSGWICRVERRA